MKSVVERRIAWYKAIVTKTFSDDNACPLIIYARKVKNTISFAELKKNPIIEPLM